ncbi:unnamed protein product [Adineta ricciae]|nr:unnamed protein product [Adineta ricciae]
MYQLAALKSTINSIHTDHDRKIYEIFSEIQHTKEKLKEILHRMLDCSEIALNKDILERNIEELMQKIDKQTENLDKSVLLGLIFQQLGLAAILAGIMALSAGAGAFGVGTLGVGLLAGNATSEIIFHVKLFKLSTEIQEYIGTISRQKTQQIARMKKYFDNFEQRVRQRNANQLKIDIVWYDKEIHHQENQYFAKELSHQFSPNNYQVVLFDNEHRVINFVQTNITNNIILITTGSAGRSVISAIGHYCNITGIILFCMRVDVHRSWTEKFKKILLITNQFNEVVEKIKHIECGDIYFVNNGLSIGDARLKMPNIEVYLSINANGSIINNFLSIRREQLHHRTNMEQLYRKIMSKNIYPNGIPDHLQLANLNCFISKFLEALQQPKPEISIITLYTLEAPHYYKILNDILNRLDEELILLIGDYVKALRYALLVYEDQKNKIQKKTNMTFYRGLCLTKGNSFQEFLRKFRVGDFIIFPSFSSTSMDKREAESFTKGKGVILEISVDCTQMNRPKNISAVSKYLDEDEVLLDCFSILEVQDIKKVTDNIFFYTCELKLHI